MICVLGAAGVGSASDSNVEFPRYPALSPDGTRIVFSWRGDLWSAPAIGGESTRLTAHPSEDLRSSFTLDGSRLVFESTRDGTRNLWVMRVDGTDLRQLTALDVPVSLSSVGRAPDGTEVVTFDAVRENDLFRSPRPYQVPLEGGTISRVFDAFGTRTAASADGSRILFDRGGASWSRRGYRGPDARNVWLFEVGDGSFTPLTSWAGNDGAARWGAEGDVIYLSDAEDGVVNVMRRQTTDGTDVPGTPLTRLERDARDLAVSADGRSAAFGSWDRLYTLDLTTRGASAAPIALTAPEDARTESPWRRIDKDITEARLNPDGKSIAIVAFGDLFIRSLDDKSRPVRITDTPWRERQIAWSPDGRTLYFTSDESERDEIHAVEVSRTRSELRRAFNGESESAPADAPADPPADSPADPPADAPSDAPTDAATEAPGDAVAEEPATPPADASKDTPKRRSSGDWAEAIRFDFHPIVVSDGENREPDPSPDGSLLAFRRGRGELWVRDLKSNEERLVRGGWDSEISWRISPDGRWFAIQQQDRDFNADIWIVPVDGSAPAINVTRHPDSDIDPRWSADGRILAFRSDRVNNEFDVWSVALDKSIESKSPAELEKYYKDAADSAKKRRPLGASETPRKPAAGDEADKTEMPDKTDTLGKPGTPEKSDAKKSSKQAPPTLSLDDAYLRLKRVTTQNGNEGQLEITPGGDRLIFTAGGGGDPEADDPTSGSTGLMSVKWDGSESKRLGAAGNVQQVSLTGDKIVVLRAGSVTTTPPTGGENKAIDFSASTRIDRREAMRRRFLGVSRALGEGFYHPTMKGLDWSALTARYLELAMAARTADEFDDVAARFVGELNASHQGVSSPADPGVERVAQGRLGVRTDPVDDGFIIRSVMPEGPAATAATPLLEGDIILAIADRPAKGSSTLEELLAGRVGEEVVVTVRRTSATGETVERDALIVPISSGQHGALVYRATQLANAALVHEWSDGRLGYIHIQGMSQPSLDEFERDLYAAAEGRDGLLIDVRNNGGGWTADRLLASIMAPAHAYTIPRGADPEYKLGYPRDRLFIQRYTLPITMLANEKSFSNAEIVAHAFKTLKRGTLVGETTNGGVISTGSVRLIDGTSVRMPTRGWYLPDGMDMENNGAVPDIRVPQTPEDESRGEDAQLRRAVQELLGRVGPERKHSTDG